MQILKDKVQNRGNLLTGQFGMRTLSIQADSRSHLLYEVGVGNRAVNKSDFGPQKIKTYRCLKPQSHPDLPMD